MNEGGVLFVGFSEYLVTVVYVSDPMDHYTTSEMSTITLYDIRDVDQIYATKNQISEIPTSPFKREKTCSLYVTTITY